jgi:curved DNA-binding protein CbpA
MKLNSPIFDRIRVKPGQERRPPTEDRSVCQWPGCTGAAAHRAPKGRLREGEYWGFCLDHVREYNHSYNYFAGMSDEAVARFQKDAITGHRPTWKLGFNGKQGDTQAGTGRSYAGIGDAADPFGVYTELGGQTRPRSEPAQPRRTVRNAERKALDAMGLDLDAQAPDIKAKFKQLVKRHHPDANGGDRTCEDRLREIIQAYNYLKSVGFC